MTQRAQTGVYGVQEPKAADLLSRKPRPELAAPPIIKGNRRALLLKNVDQAAGHHHQRLTGADLEAGRDEAFVVNVVSRSVSLDASDRQGLQFPGILRIEEQSNVLSSQFERLLIQTGILIRKDFFFGNIPRLPLILLIGKRAIRSPQPVRRDRQEHRQALANGREKVANIARRGKGITLRNVEGEPVLKNAACMHQGYRAVAKSFPIEFEPDQSIGLKP